MYMYMDIERMKKLLSSGIEAGNKVKAVREVIKTYTKQKQDMYDDTKELLKPSIEVQKEVKKSIDKKQNELIDQLQINDEIANIKQNEIIQNQKKKIVEAIDYMPKKRVMYNWLKSLENKHEDEDEDEEEIMKEMVKKDEAEDEEEDEDEDKDEEV